MHEPAASRPVVDAAAFDAALIRVVERAVGGAGADNTGARVLARLAARRWYPTVPQLLAVPAVTALVVMTLWHEPRSLTDGAKPSSVSTPGAASSTAPAEASRGAATSAPDHRGAEPRATIAAVPVAIAANARRRGRIRSTAPADDVAVAVPTLTPASNALAELTDHGSQEPAPLPVDHLELAPIVATALDPGRDR